MSVSNMITHYRLRSAWELPLPLFFKKTFTEWKKFVREYYNKALKIEEIAEEIFGLQS